MDRDSADIDSTDECSSVDWDQSFSDTDSTNECSSVDWDQSYSDSEGEDEDIEVDHDMFQPIYENAKITVCGVYCAIMEMKRKCRLPFTTVAIIL